MQMATLQVNTLFFRRSVLKCMVIFPYTNLSYTNLHSAFLWSWNSARLELSNSHVRREMAEPPERNTDVGLAVVFLMEGELE